MYSNKWDKQKPNQSREKYKHFHPEYHQYDPKNPTFSSSLLNQINKSLKSRNKTEHHYKDELRKNRGGAALQEEKMSSLRRACMVEKWMEKEVSDKIVSHGRRPKSTSSSLPSSPPTATKSRSRRKTTLLDEFDEQDTDTMFFSSTTTTMTTTTTTSETEYSVFRNPRAPHWSSHPPPRAPKPVRTRAAIESRYLVDQIPGLDRNSSNSNSNSNNKDEVLIKSRSRAPPVSPGARLTSFLSSLFEGKSKSKSKSKSNSNYNINKEWKSEQATPRTCSSATSFSRSCLSRNSSPTSKKKVEPRTVRFCPVSVIVDEDSRPCGQKSLYINEVDERENSKKSMRSISKRYEELRKLSNIELDMEERENDANRKKKLQQQKELEEVALDLLNGYWDSKLSNKSHNQIDDDVDYGVNHGVNYDQNDDGLSCSSSDLFELDHLSLIGNEYELPVYETTQFDSKFL